jgi:hypothetical protein
VVLQLIFQWEVGQGMTINIIDVSQELEGHKMLQTVNRIVPLTQHQYIDDLSE